MQKLRSININYQRQQTKNKSKPRLDTKIECAANCFHFSNVSTPVDYGTKKRFILGYGRVTMFACLVATGTYMLPGGME